MNYFNTIVLLLLLGVVSACGSKGDAEGATDTTEVQAEATMPADLGVQRVTLNDSLPSPLRQVTANIEGVPVTITYGSPAKKGRTLWGDLVAYDEVWRTGANDATTFEVAEAVTIEGQTLPAGKYALFTIPGADDWTIIFNEKFNQWGAYNYDPELDVMRVKVVPKTTETTSETMEFDVVDGNVVVLQWGDLAVPFAVSKAE